MVKVTGYSYGSVYTTGGAIIKTVLRKGDNLVEKPVCYGAPNLKSDLIFWKPTRTSY